MTKSKMADNQDQEFLTKLSEYPELRGRFEEILALMGNERGDANTADEAEERAVEEVRQLGHEVMQGWAGRQPRRLEKEYAERADFRRKEKKAKLANALWSSLVGGTDLSTAADGQTSTVVSKGGARRDVEG
jgi:hypothetical protein